MNASCEPLKIGLCLNSYNATEVHEECVNAAQQAARLCRELGHVVSEITPAHDVEAFWPNIEPVFAANVATAVAGIGTLRGKPVAADEIEVNTRQMLEMAAGMSAQDFLIWRAAMNQISRQVAAQFADIDVILTPTMAVPEIPLGGVDTMNGDRDQFTKAITRTIAFTSLFNVTGMPAITLPVVRRVYAMISRKLGEPGKTAVDLARLDELEAAIDNLKRAVRSMR